MRLSSWMLLYVFAFIPACSKAGDKAEEPAIVTVLYNTPKDAAAFEKHYSTIHVPLVVENQQKIGFKRVDLTRFGSALDGKKPAFYRQAELYFDSMDDLQKGIATPEFKKVADDLSKFATGGLLGMIATTTNEHETGGGEPGAIVTVIYKAPKDTAAFEKYYAETHLPLVTTGQKEIGFTRAELTRFNANLDGSKPARYRQAELYFPSMDAAKKGVATPAFKKVGDDLAKFADGGLDALVGTETK